MTLLQTTTSTYLLTHYYVYLFLKNELNCDGKDLLLAIFVALLPFPDPCVFFSVTTYKCHLILEDQCGIVSAFKLEREKRISEHWKLKVLGQQVLFLRNCIIQKDSNGRGPFLHPPKCDNCDKVNHLAWRCRRLRALGKTNCQQNFQLSPTRLQLDMQLT